MRVTHRVVMLCALAACVTGSPVPADQEPQPAPLTFAVRANPDWAVPLNRLLSDIAEPFETALPEGAEPEAWVAAFCGGHARRIESKGADERGRLRIAFEPCLRVRRDASLRVSSGDTAERLVWSYGLPRSKAAGVEVQSSDPAREATFETMRPGDILLVPAIPLWTRIIAKPDRIKSRADFLTLLASTVDCGAANPERCLASRDILVLDEARDREPNMFEATLAAAAAVASPPVSHADPGSLDGPPVHPDQWPYDAALVEAILRDAGQAARTPIGIADGALGDERGFPIPPPVFAPPDEGDPEPDLTDDDTNGYLDDLIGGGPPRSAKEILRSGDVGLCNPPADYPSWHPAAISQASHGAVVSAIATGARLYGAASSLPLPSLVFYRMIERGCGPSAFAVGAGEVAFAIEYLRERTQIITLAYTIDKASSPQLEPLLEKTLANGDILLVVPAGNHVPGDLDRHKTCPACLASSAVQPRVARSTLVVGAATRNLRRASYSNFGERTVGLFAPGEPEGTVDLAGRRLGAADSSTSFAAPYAALAAGLLRSLGLVTMTDIRDRLSTSTWPLDDPPSRTDVTHVGVLDLVKAVALKHDAVEVIEPGPSGTPVRRTYVGRLAQRLDQIAICPTLSPYSANSVHALRIGPANAAGERRIVAQLRKGAPIGGGRPWDTRTCRPQGTLTLDTLTSGVRVFDLSDVSHIQIRW